MFWYIYYIYRKLLQMIKKKNNKPKKIKMKMTCINCGYVWDITPDDIIKIKNCNYEGQKGVICPFCKGETSLVYNIII